MTTQIIEEAPLDGAKLEQFVFRAVDEDGATLNAALVVIGDRLGLYRALAGAGAGGVGDPRRVQHRAERVLEQPWQIRRAVLVAERDRLLGSERVAAVRVLHVPARGLGVEPLAHVALTGPGALRELSRGEAAGSGERSVEAELVAHHDERGVERGADLVDGAEDELLELAGVHRRVIDGGHGPRLATAWISCNTDT